MQKHHGRRVGSPLRSLAAGVALSWFCQCAASGPDSPTPEHNYNAERFYPDVVRIETPSELCSGALVEGTFAEPAAVLTAQHCVRPDAPEEVRVRLSDGKRLQVLRVHVPPEAEIRGHDIALLQLKEEVMGVSPRSWSREGALSIGTPVVVVGYGPRDARGREQQRQAKATIVDPAPYGISLHYNEAAIGEPVVCHGDSGGPAVGAQGAVVGIVARGRSDCAGGAVVTRVSAFEDLLSVNP